MLKVITFLNLNLIFQYLFRQKNSSKTHESFPSLTNFTKALYVGIGEEPVGNPNTNGFSGVGAKSLILWK